MERLPAGWFSSPKGSSLWVTGYLAVRVHAELDAPLTELVLGNVQITILKGSITYWDSASIKVRHENDALIFETGDVSQKSTPNGTYLVLTTPHDRDGIVGVEATTRTRISETVALLTTVFGRNVAFQKLFDNVLSLENLQTSFFSPIIENPNAFPAVIPSASRIALVGELFLKLSMLPTDDQNRIHLALRWYEQAIFDSGVDGFLKFWIAIETLAMPDTSHIRKLEILLGSAYKLDEESVRSTFLIGRIFGLRSRIVHSGNLVSIHSGVLRYLDAVFVDALYAVLGLPIERRALAAVTGVDFDLKTYLHESRK